MSNSIAATGAGAVLAFAIALVGSVAGAGVAAKVNAVVQNEPDGGALYQVVHQLRIHDLPMDARSVRVWFWLPDDDVAQRTESLTIRDAPPGYLIVQEPTTGSRFLYAEAAVAGDESVVIDTAFRIERRRVAIPLDPDAGGSLADIDPTRFGRELAPDEPHMVVTDEIRALAGRLCGVEQNVVRQIEAIYAYVVDETDHYSKCETAPRSSGIGSAAYCLAEKGGGCTDQHALFIALARARGIPARLNFGSRLQPRNEGVAVDPGYRCWVEYFVPHVGWVPTDCSAGDTVSGMREFYRSGLDENRIRFCRGRHLNLPNAARPVDYFIGAYVEVDGRPHTAFERTMIFERLPGGRRN